MVSADDLAMLSARASTARVFQEYASLRAWAPSQYKDCLPRYVDSHIKDKMVARSSYL